MYDIILEEKCVIKSTDSWSAIE